MTSGGAEPALVAIVEGQSEERAIGVLIRRMLAELGMGNLNVARPFRVKRNRVVRAGELERAILQAERSRTGAAAIMVLLDADTDCPAGLAPALRERAAKTTNLATSVVFPTVEIEAWILAGIESVRGVRAVRLDAVAPADPEAVRDAKGAISTLIEGPQGYVATADQAAFFSRLDLAVVEARSPSFAKFKRDLAGLAAAFTS